MDEQEEELMKTVTCVVPDDKANQSDDEILLIDVEEKAKQWVDLVATLDTDTIAIGEEPAVEYVEESVIEAFDREEVRLVR